MSIINEIPIINVQNLFETEENPVIIDQIQHACKEYGFFYICNHQIDTSLINEFRQISKEFFKFKDDKSSV